MNEEQKNEVIESLVEFVIRASQENATDTEITYLPDVAKLLFSYSVWPELSPEVSKFEIAL
jgi:hypothetical protein